ncbi:alpha/beta hydrolase [Undibacterium fentianense]|uniref:Alpha/beta hydrolase n=1 Tax=Undibacterium fentianense TaxID=2828728 RepID=A0A941E3E3_9BURK|nr:alpha/beta hydrolase [Undibacterium fentianense]MBR7800276.1 alpha/beta hydrolase [Undibacterium fentianense]
MRSIVAFIFTLVLTACKTVTVEESMFIRPDHIAPYANKQVFNELKLRENLPYAKLNELQVLVPNGHSLQGLFVQQENASVTLLYFGGNRSHIDDAAHQLAAQVGNCPINFMMFDYRGYGRTQGEPNTENLKEDALRIFDFARAKTSGKLIVHGHSLGSFMTAYIAQKRTVDGIILETTASTVEDVLSLRTPWYAKPFIRFDIVPSLAQIDNTIAVNEFQGKSLVITGENDQTTPAPLGLKVFNTIGSKEKRHVLVKEGGHNNLLQRTEVKTAYCEFVRQFN